MVTLARLHGALDAVVETEQTIAAIREASALPAHGVARISELLGEARELLRRLLVRPESRHPVGGPITSRGSSGQ
ncbi:MAG TPA: hypothetical protein VIV40_11520 [Kofleriaceae bacterium]